MKWMSGLLATFAVGMAFGFVACGSDEEEAPVAPVDASTEIAFSTTPECGDKCSSDLHEVLNCDGTVFRRCPDGEGCTPTGTCAPACESARVNKSTIGCEYFAVPPATDGNADGSCFAAFVANTWTSPINISVAYNGADLDVGPFARIPVGSGPGLTYQPLPGGQLPPGQVAVLFLADFDAKPPFPTRCPAGITAAFTGSRASANTTELLKAFSIKTTAPAVAYDIFPYGGAASFISSATLLVPVAAWGDNYVGVTGYPRGPNLPPTSLEQPFLQVAASEDGTQVTVRPNVAITGGDAGVAGGAAGQPTTYSLSRGQVLQLKQNEDLTGSIIQSTKPVGVWGGSSCMYIEVNEAACDSAHQQLYPAKALGRKYIALKHKDRLTGVEEAPPWRLVGVVDGTQLTYEPFAPSGAPTTVNTGQVISFRAAGPFVVKSQDDDHPFFLAAHMTGQQSSGKDFGVGDPEFVNVVAAEQYLRSYVFMTDPTMSNTNLALVRVKGKNGFADVELDCGGKIQGWQGVGNDGEYQVARFDLVQGGAGVGLCNNGFHSIKSDAPFGVTVWGWDFTVSYAYPAGASVKPINEVVIPAVK